MSAFRHSVVLQLFDSGICARDAAEVILGNVSSTDFKKEENAEFLLRYSALSFLKACLVAKGILSSDAAFSVESSDISELFTEVNASGVVFSEKIIDIILSRPRPVENPKTDATTQKIEESNSALLRLAIGEMYCVVRRVLADFDIALPDDPEVSV